MAARTGWIVLVSLLLLTGRVCGQDDGLFSRLQGIANRGDFFNVDGMEITAERVEAEFSARTIPGLYKQLKVKQKELTESDSLLGYRNYCLFKSLPGPGDMVYGMSYYFVEDTTKNTIAFTFSHIDEQDKEFERRFITLYCRGEIPRSVYHLSSAGHINFAGRKIPLAEGWRWMGINNVQWHLRGQMNWSVHKTQQSATRAVDAQFATIVEQSGGKVVSDTTVNVVFEGTQTTARKIVYNITGARSVPLRMEGSRTLIVYFVAAPVRGNFVSCVMSHWTSDQIGSDGLPLLLAQVMKLN